MKVGAKHILVDHEYEASDILKKISSGEKFEELARDYSTCGSAKDGGDLGEFSKGMMVKPFEKALLALEVGGISGIERTQFGYHIILRTK
jgi:parvulin-like peptidyl-prolyl isomerase